MQTSEALTAAAAALLPEASPAVIRRVLRELLADDNPSVRPPAAAPHGAANGLSIAAAPRAQAKPQAGSRRSGKGKHLRKPSAAPTDPAWAQLRVELRTAMEKRGRGLRRGRQGDRHERSHRPTEHLPLAATG